LSKLFGDNLEEFEFFVYENKEEL